MGYFAHETAVIDDGCSGFDCQPRSFCVHGVDRNLGTELGDDCLDNRQNTGLLFGE